MASSARIDELRKKFEENPRRYFAPLANEYRKVGDIEQAISICREYLPQQPGHMSGHIVYGQALYEARQYEEARTVFETALALDPENLIALRHLGDIALIVGDIAGARTWYGRVLEADPRNEEIQAQLKSLETVSGAATEPTPLSSPAVEPAAAPSPTLAGEAPAATGATPPHSPASSAPTVVVSSVPAPSLERTVELPMSAAPAALPPQSLSTAPTAEITLDQVPVPAVPEVDKLTPGTEVGASVAMPVEKAAGFEPTAVDASHGEASPPPAAAVDIETTAAPAPDAAFDSFTLEGLETTSMTPPTVAQPEAPSEGSPIADLELAPPEPSASREGSVEASAAQETQSPPTAQPTGGLEAPEASAPEGTEGGEGGDRPEAPSPSPELPFLDLGETPAAPAPAAAEPSAPDLPPMAESKPFVTETMAELYEQQGHRDEALRVYRALLEQRPGDDHIRGRIERLEGKRGPTIREILSRVASRRPVPKQAAAPAEAEPVAPVLESQPGSVAEAVAAAAPESEPSTPPASAGGEPLTIEAASLTAPELPPGIAKARVDRLGELFGNAAVSGSDENAAVTLAAAFSDASRHNGGGGGTGASGADSTGLPGSPAHPASRDLSLDTVFRNDAQGAPPASSFSFDQFFSERATAEQPATGSAGAGADQGAETTDDVAKFTQWLEGLKQR